MTLNIVLFPTPFLISKGETSPDNLALIMSYLNLRCFDDQPLPEDEKQIVIVNLSYNI